MPGAMCAVRSTCDLLLGDFHFGAAVLFVPIDFAVFQGWNLETLHFEG